MTLEQILVALAITGTAIQAIVSLINSFQVSVSESKKLEIQTPEVASNLLEISSGQLSELSNIVKECRESRKITEVECDRLRAENIRLNLQNERMRVEQSKIIQDLVELSTTHIKRHSSDGIECPSFCVIQEAISDVVGKISDPYDTKPYGEINARREQDPN